MPTKTETPSEAIRRLTGATALRADRLRDVLDSLGEMKEAAEAAAGADVENTAQIILDALDSLEQFVGTDVATECRDGLESLVNAVTALDLDAFTDAYDAAEQSLDVVEEYRDDPSSADAETKADARDECRGEFDALADALDSLDAA